MAAQEVYRIGDAGTCHVLPASWARSACMDQHGLALAISLAHAWVDSWKLLGLTQGQGGEEESLAAKNQPWAIK